ncbi:MAG: MerC domain-containing protein [Bacteroidota bacterium]
MMDLQLKNSRTSDILGASASTLCLIHCLATPLLFVAQAEAVHHEHDHAHHHAAGPSWWGMIDIALLFVSLAAVYWTIKNTSKQWMKIAISASWVILAMIILNEKFELLHIAEAWIYAPTVSLVLLHLYNRKYCQCEDEDCPVPAE